VPVPVPRPSGTVYYVSPTGNDANNGTSSSSPWRTVARVDRADLKPGDAVLFRGGARFSGAALMPWTSGTASAPIVFGSYGSGRAEIVRGAWFTQDHLDFEHLRFGATFYGGSNDRGTSNDIVLDHVYVDMPAGNQGLGLFANGSGWTIEESKVTGAGLSGMLLWGSRFLVTSSTIARTGSDTTNGYNNHGIYLDASDATITDNTIENFAASGISVRYHGSVIESNLITGGQIGIDFFQTDPVAGRATWVGNAITATTTAGIYVSPEGAAGLTRTSFLIARNEILPAAGVRMNISPSVGSEMVRDNPGA
jgi:hypothetical protein